MDVLFELPNGLGTEGVRHHLAFPGMLSSVARIEETALDRDEGIVVLAARRKPMPGVRGGDDISSPFQEAISVTVDDLNRIWICDGDVVWLNADDLSQSLVCLVNGPVTATMSTLVHEP